MSVIILVLAVRVGMSAVKLSSRLNSHGLDLEMASQHRYVSNFCRVTYRLIVALTTSVEELQYLYD
jgi:hypothetical protein